MIRVAALALVLALVAGSDAGAEVVPGGAGRAVHPPPKSVTVLPGDRPQLLPKSIGPLVGVPQLVTPPLGVGPLVFPVYGQATLFASYGAESGSSFVRGDDIEGALGQPLVAAAAGTVFSVGWTPSGGNTLWLRDHRGNLYFYADLAEFSQAVRNGVHVRAGEVIGFMGNTGTDGTAMHLHFEVHPVSLIYLGENGAVDPTSYLETWRHLTRLQFPVTAGWAPSPPGVAKAPEPGALLLGSTDIATGGLAVAKRSGS
jgi:murein DD-endopeptidase MepM/ murein hydrolase activator NlpD